MIRTIFFDLGGVLVDFNQQAMLENIKDHCDPSRFKLEDFQERYEKGSMSSEELKKTLELKDLSLEELLSSPPSIFSLKTEMLPLLLGLRKKGIRLVTLSNTCEAHFVYLQKQFRFLDLFDDFVLSYEVNARKPETKIYVEALKKSMAPPEECFYVDDVEEFVLAARRLGIDSHLFKGIEGLLQALKERGCALDFIQVY